MKHLKSTVDTKISKVFLVCSILFLLGVSYFQIKGCLNCPGSPILEKIPVLYYYEKGNPACVKATKLLQVLGSSYGELGIEMEDINNPKIRDWLVYLNKTYRGSPEVRVPAVFVGNQLFLVGYEEIYDGLLKTVIPQIEAEYPKDFKRTLLKILRKIKLSIITLSNTMLVTTVITAGIVDSINPCAISLFIFLISSLARIQDIKSKIFSVGTGFILGSFLAYFAIGIGILKFITSTFTAFISAYNFIYILFGIVAMLLGILSLIDAYYAKKSNIKKMKLQLPLRIKQISHYFVRNINKTNIVGGFLLGALMSIFEFPCSGQVYLPTITIIGNPLSGSKQFLLLLIYNFMFVLPLIIVILVFKFYYSSSIIVSFVSRNLFRTKVLTAMLFFALGSYLLFLA